MADEKKQDDYVKRSGTIARWTLGIFLFIAIPVILILLVYLIVYRWNSGNGEGTDKKVLSRPERLTGDWKKHPINEGERCEPYALAEGVQIAIRQNGNDELIYILEPYSVRKWQKDGSEVTPGNVPVKFIEFKAARSQDAGAEYRMKCTEINPKIPYY